MPDSLQRRLVGAASAMLSALPLSWVRSLGRALGRIGYRFDTRAARTSRRNLALCSGPCSAEQRRRLARRSLEETGALLLEMGLVWHAPPQRALAQVRRVRGAELLESALDAGRGLLILGPHLGNWELLNLWLASRGPLTALHASLRDPALDAWIRRARERTGARLVPTDAGGIRALLRTLRAGGMAGILPDQVPARGAGRHAPFMGHPALTMTLVQRLLCSTHADALMAMALRVPDGFELHFRRPAAGLDDADPQRAARALNASVEECIALAPSQYQWSYKRFKHPPPDRPDPYRRK